MTVKELSQLYFLTAEIELCERHLRELELQRGVTPIHMDGMPKGKGSPQSQVEQLAAEIVDLQAIIHAKRIQCIHERARLERYIHTIPDVLTRLIFSYRFVDCMKWEDVAEAIGEGTTADRVKKICYRYIDREAERTERQLTEARLRSEEYERGHRTATEEL